MSVRKRIAIPVLIIGLLIAAIFIFVKKDEGNNLLDNASILHLYKDGEKAVIDKNDNDFSEEMYERISDLIVVEFPDIYGGQPFLSEDEFKDKKSFSVEYVLDEMQAIQMNNDNTLHDINVTSVIFPLDEEWEYQVYMKTEEDQYFLMNYREDLPFLVEQYVRSH